MKNNLQIAKKTGKNKSKEEKEKHRQAESVRY